MNITLGRWVLLAGALAGAPAGAALESFTSYDKFSGDTVDASKWSTFERSRSIQRKALNHLQRDWGPTGSDTGGFSTNFTTNLTDPARVTQLQAKVLVNTAEVTHCPGNASFTGSVLARLIGAFFNVGTPVSGSQLGDVLGLVTVTRAANSADPVGVLQVGGSVVVCQNSDCSLVTNIGNFTGLGTVTTGQAVTLSLEWDHLTKTFKAIRDGVTTATVSYTVNDRAAPGNNFKQLSTRTNLASCTGARTTGLIDASFDNVSVNKTAIR